MTREDADKAVDDCWNRLVGSLRDAVKRFNDRDQGRLWNCGLEENDPNCFRVSRQKLPLTGEPVIVGKYCKLTDREITSFTVELGRRPSIQTEKSSAPKGLFRIEINDDEGVTASLRDHDNKAVTVEDAAHMILFPFLEDPEFEPDGDI
ncbi:MAG TPA: hypothetical protein VMH80_03410 [Bryobacteraceae bacterium]|nr:hypothetical protein [Bryobacteraceae bacterium]